MQRQVYNAHTNNKPAVQPIALGGTGSTSEVDACIALNILRYSEIGTEAVPLDNNSKVPVQYIPGLTVVSGDTIDFKEQGAGFTIYTDSQNVIGNITNYDCEREYTLLAANAGQLYLYTQENKDQGTIPGSVNISSETLKVGDLIYVAPSSSGNTGIQINMRQFTINVTQSTIDRPTITAPLNNAALTTFPQDVHITVGHVNGYVGPSLTAEVQIASDNYFGTNLQTHTGDPGNDVIQIPSMSNGSWYIRSRWVGASTESPWSVPIQVTVQVASYPTSEVVILHRPDIQDGLNGGYFGNQLAVSPDGTVLAIADPLVNVLPAAVSPLQRFGRIYVYKKINSTWVYQAAIDNGLLDSLSTGFGSSIVITPDNQKIIVGSGNSRELTANGNGSGLVQIFKTSVVDDYSTLSVVQTIGAAPYAYDFMDLGRTIRLSSDGLTMAVTFAGQRDKLQRVFIFTYDGTSFTKTAEIVNPAPSEVSNFAVYSDSIELSSDGTRLLINDWYTSNLIYVYDFDGTTWNLTDTLSLPSGSYIVNFGLPMAFSSNKNKFACSAQVRGSDNRAYVYVYELIGNVWTRIHAITHTEWSGNTLGGYPSSLKFTNNDTSIIVGSNYQTAQDSEQQFYGSYHGDGAVVRISLVGLGSGLTFIGPGNYEPQEHKYVASDLDPANGSAYFGTPLAINATDSEMFVGSYYKHWSTDYNADGAVYIFR